MLFLDLIECLHRWNLVSSDKWLLLRWMLEALAVGYRTAIRLLSCCEEIHNIRRRYVRHGVGQLFHQLWMMFCEVLVKMLLRLWRIGNLHASKLLVKLRRYANRNARVIKVHLSLTEHRENVDILLRSTIAIFHEYLLRRLLLLHHWMMIIGVVVGVLSRPRVVTFLNELLQQRMHTATVIFAIEPEATDG